MLSTSVPKASAVENGDCAGHIDPQSLPGLLERLVKSDPDFAKGDCKGHYQIRLHETWMVVRAINPDDFDFMRLDRAIRERITERGWHYGLGLMSSIVLKTKLARVCIPGSADEQASSYIPRPMWIWESHESEDAIALLRAYVQGLEKVEELRHADHAAA